MRYQILHSPGLDAPSRPDGIAALPSQGHGAQGGPAWLVPYSPGARQSPSVV